MDKSSNKIITTLYQIAIYSIIAGSGVLIIYGILFALGMITGNWDIESI